MTTRKGDEKLGVVQAEGLRGPLCWSAAIFSSGSSACIESAPAPASPTEEELAAAKAWERRDLLDLSQAAADAECAASEAAAEAVPMGLNGYVYMS